MVNKGFRTNKLGMIVGTSALPILGPRSVFGNGNNNDCPFGHYRNALGVCLWGIPPAGTTIYGTILAGTGGFRK